MNGAEPTAGLSSLLKLESGEVATELSGAESGQLVIGIPGLSANLRSFDVIYEAVDGARHRKLAFDPRGRGRSDGAGRSRRRLLPGPSVPFQLRANFARLRCFASTSGWE